MKSVIVVSVMTFVLIFGGVAFISNRIGRDPGPDPAVLAEMAELEQFRTDLESQRTAVDRETRRLALARAGAAIQARALEDGLDRLQAMVREIETRNAEQIRAREESAAHLAKVYENMKPAQAAPIIAALEMETILDILSRMRERQAARILASMDTATAALISAELSQGGRG